MKHGFKPENMRKHSRELYKVVKGKAKKVKEEHGITPEVLSIDTEEDIAEYRKPAGRTDVIQNVELKQEKFEDLTLIKDCVCVVGSTVKQYEDEEHSPNDVDLLVRIDPKYDYLKRAIRTRLEKMDNDAYWKDGKLVIEINGEVVRNLEPNNQKPYKFYYQKEEFNVIYEKTPQTERVFFYPLGEYTNRIINLKEKDGTE